MKRLLSEAGTFYFVLRKSENFWRPLVRESPYVMWLICMKFENSLVLRPRWKSRIYIAEWSIFRQIVQVTRFRDLSTAFDASVRYFIVSRSTLCNRCWLRWRDRVNARLWYNVRRTSLVICATGVIGLIGRNLLLRIR